MHANYSICISFFVFVLLEVKWVYDGLPAQSRRKVIWFNTVFCNPGLSPGVLQESELRLSTETEISWTTLCLTAGSGTWAVGCSMCGTLPRLRPPPPSLSLKWSQMRWRVASRCRATWWSQKERDKTKIVQLEVAKWNYVVSNFDMYFFSSTFRCQVCFFYWVLTMQEQFVSAVWTL